MTTWIIKETIKNGRKAWMVMRIENGQEAPTFLPMVYGKQKATRTAAWLNEAFGRKN